MSLLAAQLQQENYSVNTETHDSCLALCKLALHYSSLGEYQTSLAVLMDARKLFPLPSSQRTYDN